MLTEPGGDISESMRMVLETAEGSVSHSASGDYFWIQYGNIRWRMDRDCLAPYRGYLHSVLDFLSAQENPKAPAFIRTKDPVVFLSFSRTELAGLVFLLDASDSIFSVENPARP